MQSFCRTCFLEISDTSVALDDKDHKHQLIFCIPEMNLRTFSNIKLCQECITVLNITYKFKMKCREVEDQINKCQLNITECSIPAQGSDISIYTRCKICLEDVKNNSFHLTETPFYKSKLMFCIPDMNFRIMSDINLCSNCRTILDKIYTFKVKCLDVEKNIRGYLELHKKIDFRDLSAWCNAFVKYEENGLEDYIVKQEAMDVVNESEITEDLKEQITNTTLISPKTEKLKTYECIKRTSKFKNCKCNNDICDNMEHLVFNKSKSNFNYSKRSTVQKRNTPHTYQKLYKCSLCDYSVAGKTDFKRHIRTHTGEKPFECSLCEYSAANKSTLKNHIRTHTGEKPFKCTLCDYSTAHKFTLKRHSYIHTAEKPFKCSLCEYSTVNKSTLIKHIRTHPGKKPFKCSRCEFSALNKYSLKVHICRSTGENPLSCHFKI